MQLIPLFPSKHSDAPAHAIVDDCDAWVAKWNWRAVRRGKIFYACADIEGWFVYMHRLLLIGARLIDHENGMGWDNRSQNLRPADKSKNGANSGMHADNTSGFKGVYWHPGNKKWRARIMRDSKRVHLGFFLSAEEAARAYDKAALKFFGKFARPNFPEENCCTNARPSVSCDSE